MFVVVGYQSINQSFNSDNLAHKKEQTLKQKDRKKKRETL